MGHRRPVEGDDPAAGQPFTDVVVGAASAEPDFEDQAVHAGDFGAGEIEQRALRRHAANEAVEAAHRLQLQ